MCMRATATTLIVACGYKITTYLQHQTPSLLYKFFELEQAVWEAATICPHPVQVNLTF